MGHSPADHVEHAEHAAHAAHDEFNKRVTMSIAIVAAVLACVTMLSHRGHNETLRLQGEALSLQGEALRLQSSALELQTKASIQSTKAANKWAYYQSKNIFNLESEIMLDLLSVIATKEGSQENFKKVHAHYKDFADKYGKRLPLIEEEGHAMSKEVDEFVAESQKKMLESQEAMKAAHKSSEASHIVHQKTDRFDYGELGLQLGVVLCSLAILTKGRTFWYTGLVSALIGALVAATGQFNLFLNTGHH